MYCHEGPGSMASQKGHLLRCASALLILAHSLFATRHEVRVRCIWNSLLCRGVGALFAILSKVRSQETMFVRSVKTTTNISLRTFTPFVSRKSTKPGGGLSFLLDLALRGVSRQQSSSPFPPPRRRALSERRVRMLTPGHGFFRFESYPVTEIAGLVCKNQEEFPDAV